MEDVHPLLRLDPAPDPRHHRSGLRHPQPGADLGGRHGSGRRSRPGSATDHLLGRRRRHPEHAPLRHARRGRRASPRADRDLRPGRRLRVQHRSTTSRPACPSRTCSRCTKPFATTVAIKTLLRNRETNYVQSGNHLQRRSRRRCSGRQGGVQSALADGVPAGNDPQGRPDRRHGRGRPAVRGERVLRARDAGLGARHAGRPGAAQAATWPRAAQPRPARSSSAPSRATCTTSARTSSP